MGILRASRLRSAAFLALSIASPAVAQQEAPEYSVKAAYVYNFIRFVEWPEKGRSDSINLYVVGPQTVVSSFRTALEGKTVGDRPIQVKAATSPGDIKNAHALYVAGSDTDRAREFVKAVSEKDVLTITEASRFPSVGSLINFYISEGTVRFAVNATVLEKSLLKVSSQMLQFAAIVRLPEPPR